MYILMYEMNILGLDDVKLAQEWLQDLVRVGYRFPPVTAPDTLPAMVEDATRDTGGPK